MNISILYVLSIGIYRIEALCENCTETVTCLEPWTNVSMWTNVSAWRRTPIYADIIKYRNIIETDMTLIGCDYVDWSILVGETYDTGFEYNFIKD